VVRPHSERVWGKAAPRGGDGGARTWARPVRHRVHGAARRFTARRAPPAVPTDTAPPASAVRFARTRTSAGVSADFIFFPAKK